MQQRRLNPFIERIAKACQAYFSLSARVKPGAVTRICVT